MLRGNAQGRPVFHQAHVVDVGHLGTAHPGIDPAHHITQQTLRVVFQFLAHFGFGPVGAQRQRRGQQIAKPGGRPQRQFALHGEHIDRMVMHRVQRGGGGRRNPGGVGAGLGMADFLHHHIGHHVGRGPHPLADLRLAGQPAGEPDLHVARLVCGNPRGAFDRAFAQHRPGLHRGVDLVPGAVEETGVDKHDPVFDRMNARGKIGRRPPFFVHHADFDRVARQAEQVFGRIEQIVSERAFLGPVHLGFDDVDAAGAAVGVAAKTREAKRADCAGHHCVHDAFGNFGAIGQQDRRVGHQVADVAHE